MKNPAEMEIERKNQNLSKNTYEMDQEKNPDYYQDSDELISKIYEENINNIANLSGWMQILEIILIISLISLLITLIFKFTSYGGFSWLYVLIPSIITILSGLITANLFLRLKDILEQTEEQIKEANIKANNSNNQSENSSKFVQLFSFIIINFMFLLMLIFVALLAFRLDHLINIKQIHIVFIPLYSLFVLGLVYTVFISPAFVNNQLYFEIFLIFLYQISAIIFFLLLGDKINNQNTKLKYGYIFIAYYAPISAHMLYFIVSLAIKKEKILSYIFSICSLLLFFLGGLLIHLKNDLVIKNEKHYIDIIIILSGFIVFSLDSLINMYFEVQTNNEKE